MPTLSSIFKSIFLTQIFLFFAAVTIPIDILDSKKKFKKKKNCTFIDELVLIISFNTILFSG